MGGEVIDKVPMVPAQAASLGRAYHEWQRHQQRLERFRDLNAPESVIETEVRMCRSALEALSALGWKSGAVRVHHTPFDLDRGNLPSASRVLLRARVLVALSERAICESEGKLESIGPLQ